MFSYSEGQILKFSSLLVVSIFVVYISRRLLYLKVSNSKKYFNEGNGSSFDI